MRRAGLPGWTLLLPTVVIFLALGFVLGRQVSRRRALVVAAASSLLFLAIGWTIFWIKFGQSPAIWFDKGSTIYMMPPLLGIASGASIWMLGAWLGSRSRGSATPPPIKG